MVCSSGLSQAPQNSTPLPWPFESFSQENIKPLLLRKQHISNVLKTGSRWFVLFSHSLLRLSHTFFSTSFATIFGTFSEAESKWPSCTQYSHDILDGTNSTAINIVAPPKRSMVALVLPCMIDGPLMQGPEPTSSKLVGRAQGCMLWLLNSQYDPGFLLMMNSAILGGNVQCEFP